jgi:hypothetical protein
MCLLLNFAFFLDNLCCLGYYVTQMAAGERARGGRKEQKGMFTKGFWFYYFSVDCRFAS